MARSIIARLAPLLLVAGCAGPVDTRKIDAETHRLFDQIAARQYAAIYAEAAPELRAGAPATTFVGFMQRIDRRLGACKTPVKAATWSASATTSGYFATQGYTAACANGPLDMTVTIVLRNGQAMLAGYHVNSSLLLTD